MEEVEIRALAPSDMPFVFATWLKSYKSSRHARRIRHSIYYAHHHKVIEHAIDRMANHSYVAHMKGDPDVIFGYLICEKPDLVHYCFVKEAFRLNGIARMLLEAASANGEITITHWTFALDPIVKKYEDLITYDPYRA